MYEQILSAVIGSLLTVVVGYATFKLTLPSIKKELFTALLDEKSLENALQVAINNEKLQKFLYEAGGLVGSGASAGLGLGGRSGGGKLKLQDLIMQLAGGYLQNKLPGIVGQAGAGENQPSQQNINSQSNKVGY